MYERAHPSCHWNTETRDIRLNALRLVDPRAHVMSRDKKHQRGKQSIEVSSCILKQGRLENDIRSSLSFELDYLRTSKMGADQEKVDKIRAFADRGRNLEKQYGENPLSLDAIQHYNRRLDDTIRSLQDHVKQQEDTLRKVSHTL